MQKKIIGAQTDISISELNDVSLASPSQDDVLTYDAGSWIAAPPGVADSAIIINEQAADYVLQLSDAFNTLVKMTKSTVGTVTIPDDTTVAWPDGANVLIGWNGLGQISIVAGAGVTILTPDTLNIGTRYGKITAIRTGPNLWEIEGNLELL